MSIISYHEKAFDREVYTRRGLSMGYKYNVSCSETVSKNWTPTAIDCYLLGCTCSRCHLYKIYFVKNNTQCKMKETVIELVRRFGIPENPDNTQDTIQLSQYIKE